MRPCIIQEALDSPGCTLDVSIIICFSIGFTSFFYYLPFFISDLYLLKPVDCWNYFYGEQSPAAPAWPVVGLLVRPSSYFLEVVRLVKVSPCIAVSGLGTLFVIIRYSTLFPAREWHRVSRFAFSFVTLVLRYCKSMEYVYGTLWAKYISFSPFSNS